MDRIVSLDNLSDMVARQMRRGVYTNTFISSDEYKREIDGGSLFAHMWGNGLIILRRRPDHYKTNFYLNSLEEAPGSMPDGTYVMEIPIKAGTDGAADELLQYWTDLGFERRFSRLRLMRAAGNPVSTPNNSGVEPAPAKPEDTGQILHHMRECFDHLTGCLPTEDELKADILAGGVLCVKGLAGRVEAAIHFKHVGKSSQIRHLSVSQSLRGRGVAGILLKEYLFLTGWNRALVWTGTDNNAALSAYRKLGYEPDGWRSEVMVKN